MFNTIPTTIKMTSEINNPVEITVVKPEWKENSVGSDIK